MATAEERAKEQEARALARAGFNPDGTPMNNQPPGRQPNPADDDDDDDDGDDPTADLLRRQQEDRQNQNQNQNQNRGDDTDVLRQQIEKLQADLAAANSRAAPEQQRAQEMRDLWQASERARVDLEQRFADERAQLEARLEAQRPAFDINSVLTDEDRERFDGDTLNTIVKISEAIAKAHAPKIDARSETLKVLEERERKSVETYRNKVLTDPTRGLHQLAQLSYDPAFQAWSNEEDNDMESVVTSLLNATSTEAVDRFAKIVAKRIKTFKDRSTNSDPTDPKTSLSGSMRRTEKPRMTDAQKTEKYNEAKRLARGNSADRAKAEQILKDLQ